MGGGGEMGINQRKVMNIGRRKRMGLGGGG